MIKFPFISWKVQNGYVSGKSIHRLSIFFISSIAIIFLTITTANACVSSGPGRNFHLDHDRAIEDAGWIARVAAPAGNKPTKRSNNYFGGSRNPTGVYEVLEYLKGSGPSKIKAYIPESSWHSMKPAEANYFGHRASVFGSFAHYLDQDIVDSSCEWGTPLSNKNPFLGDNKTKPYREYLVFGPELYAVGFENIAGNDDMWLQYVRAKLDSNALANRPLFADWQAYLSKAEAVVHMRITWNGEKMLFDEEILKGPKLEYKDLIFVSAERQFGRLADPECSPRLPEFESSEYLFVFEVLPREEITVSAALECRWKYVLHEYPFVTATRNFSINGRRAFHVVTTPNDALWPALPGELSYPIPPADLASDFQGADVFSGVTLDDVTSALQEEN